MPSATSSCSTAVLTVMKRGGRKRILPLDIAAASGSAREAKVEYIIYDQVMCVVLLLMCVCLSVGVGDGGIVFLVVVVVVVVVGGGGGLTNKNIKYL